MTRALTICGLLACIGCASSHETVVSDSTAAARDTSKIGQPVPDTVRSANRESFRAVGQEPGWLLTISDSLRLQWDYDARRLTVATPTLQATASERTYAFTHQDTAFTVRITDTPCADGMSGHEYPSTVTVQIGARLLKGCGGEPGAMLRGAEWNVDSLDGKPLVSGSAITMQFASDGNVSGTAGCNRYRASVDVRGNDLHVGPAMSTRMACSADINAQETRFLAVLGEPLRFYVERGALHLTRDNGDVIVARRR